MKNKKEDKIFFKNGKTNEKQRKGYIKIKKKNIKKVEHLKKKMSICNDL